MTFPPEFLDEIRARVGLTDLIGRRVNLKRRGREAEGLCPFHNEKTPSFTVSEQKGFYHCFGCGAHGDVIGFVMRSEGLAFPEAVEKLAGEAGLPMPARSPADVEAAARRKELGDVLEVACGWFEAQLAGPGGAAARSYLAGRGLRDETVGQFRLGFAPRRRGGLRKALNAKGLGDGALIEAGLLKAAEDGGEPREYFFDRIIFPIEDRRGRVIAFGGRALGEAKAKYLNSPDTDVFHKGRVLYNLARARQAAHDTGEVVVVEGYMDVLAMSQAGFPAAVAPLGTAVTESQIAALWRLAPEPLLCLDGDAAGRRAAHRAALTALPGLAPGRSLRFALLPPGEDPDSLLAGAGPGALRAVLDGALDLSRLLWSMETEGRNFATPERQAALWQSLGRRVEEIGSAEVRNAYRLAMEERFEAGFGYNPRTGRRVAAGPRPRGPGGPPGPGRPPGVGRGVRRAPAELRRRQEQVLLATAINHPELLVEHAEELAGLTLASTDLHGLARALVDLMAAAPDLDTAALKCHLSDQGYSKVLEGLLRREVYQLGPCARPETELAQARSNWLHLLALHRERQAMAETAKAARLSAGGPGEQGLAWLEAWHSTAEGGESKRVEFDSPGESGPRGSS